MRDEKLIEVNSILGTLLDLYVQQFSLIKNVIHFLMDGESKNAMETNEEILEFVQRTLRERKCHCRNSETEEKA